MFLKSYGATAESWNGNIPVQSRVFSYLNYTVSFVNVFGVKRRTDTGRQRVVPGSPFPGHALQCGRSVQGVSRLTSVCDAAPREVTLVIDLEAKLGDAWVLTVRQFKT